MAVTVPNQWTKTAGRDDAEIPVVPTGGNWLVATVAWRVTDGSAPLMSLGDYSRNLWTLLYDSSKFAFGANDAAQLYVQVWACPAVQYDGWRILNVYAAAMAISTDDVGSVCVNVSEIAGMASGHLTVDSVTVGTATAANSITLTAPAPSGAANCLMIAAACTDIAFGSVTTTGTGWAALTTAVRAAPNAGLAAAWREATTGGGVTFALTAGFFQSWAGVVVAIRTTGIAPVQPNANWPITRLLVGLGYQLNTPLSAVAWTDQTTRLVDTAGTVAMHAPRGIPYDQGVVNSEQALVSIRNDDGAYTPRTPGSATANASGTTSTIKIPDAQAANIYKGDFFRLLTAAGAFKQLAVFQVTGTASAAGTTTVTFVRADGTGVATASTASGDRYSGIGIDLFIPWQKRMYWQGKWYPVGTGWLGDLSQTWTDAHWGQVPATGIDAIATLPAADSSMVRGEIMRRNPTHYWPMDDAAGSGYAANASGLSNAQLAQAASKFGTGASNTADFGAGTQAVDIGSFSTGVLGDAGSGWAQSGLTQAEGAANKGYALVCTTDDFPPIAGGVTIVGCLLTTDTNTGTGTYDSTVFIIRNADPQQALGQGSIMKLHIPHPGANTTVIKVWDKDTHAITSTTGPASTGLEGLNSQARTWAVTFNRTSWTAYVNGSSWSGSADFPPTFSRIDVGGEADSFFHGKCWNAIHNHVAIFPRVLSAGEISAVRNALVFGSVGDTISQRLAQKLGMARWKGPRVITGSTASLDAQDPAPSTIAQTTSDLAGFDDGLTFADAAAQFQFRSRRTAYYQVSRAALGDDTGAGEIPYQVGQRYGYDTTYIYNDVEIENTRFIGYGKTAAQTFVAIDDTSAGQYGERSLPRSTRLSATASAYHLGWWLLGRYAYPRLRAQEVVINPAANPTAWAFCLGAEIGDIVMVNRRPIGAPVAISVRCRILQVTPDIGPGVATFTFVMAQAPPQVALANEPTAGVLGGTVLGA